MSFAAPRVGFPSSTMWIGRIVGFRRAFEKASAAMPPFLTAKLSYAWDIEADTAISYSAARIRLMLLCVDAGSKAAETFTLHTPKISRARAMEMSSSPDDRCRKLGLDFSNELSARQINFRPSIAHQKYYRA